MRNARGEIEMKCGCHDGEKCATEIYHFGDDDGDGFALSLQGATLNIQMWWDSACVGTEGETDAARFLARFPTKLLRAALEKR
jgi:hypothetical protein